MIREIYMALKQRLSAEIPALKQVEWHFNQFDDLQGNQLIWTTPSAYIEFDVINWQTRPGNIQAATLGFFVHMVDESHYDDEQRFTDTATINHLGNVSAVFQSLMNWRCLLSFLSEFAGLAGTSADRILMESIVRTQTLTDHNLERLIITSQRFEVRVFDYSASPVFQTVLAQLVCEGAFDAATQPMVDASGAAWVDPLNEAWGGS